MAGTLFEREGDVRTISQRQGHRLERSVGCFGLRVRSRIFRQERRTLKRKSKSRLAMGDWLWKAPGRVASGQHDPLRAFLDSGVNYKPEVCCFSNPSDRGLTAKPKVPRHDIIISYDSNGGNG